VAGPAGESRAAGPTLTPPVGPEARGSRPASPGGRSTLGSPPSGSGSGGAASPYADGAGPGAMARAYLRPSPATSLVVEVDWVSGRAPSDDALDHLRAVLRRECLKPDGIQVRRGNEIRTSRTSWRLADLVALERENRSARSGGTTATMWFVYVGGSFAEPGGEGSLGVTYSASSAAIFRDRIEEAASPPFVPPTRIERSVLLHEAGHLLALVNIGYTSRYKHEDPQHRYHSNNPDSVMYWAVESVLLRDVLRGGPPDDFDQYDRADLAMLREGG
jgi:hypothetical protein